MKQDQALDDQFGYYKCSCGHYAVDHFMEACARHRSCHKCGCKTFVMADGKEGRDGRTPKG